MNKGTNLKYFLTSGYLEEMEFSSTLSQSTGRTKFVMQFKMSANKRVRRNSLLRDSTVARMG
jgi:hypothetical protein